MQLYSTENVFLNLMFSICVNITYITDFMDCSDALNCRVIQWYHDEGIQATHVSFFGFTPGPKCKAVINSPDIDASI